MAQITLNSSGVASSGSLLLQTNGTTTQATIDTSGNLGLGVTPSAWSTTDSRAMQLRNANSSQSGNIHSINDSFGLSQNSYYASGWKYYATGSASLYWQESGSHKWGIAGSGSANGSISFTQAMTLDASGRLAIGATSVTNGTAFGGGGQVNVAKIESAGYPCFQINTNTGGGSSVQFTNSGTVNGVIGYNASGGTNEFTVNNALSGALTFATNNTERARIDSSGNLLVGTTSSATGAKLSVVQATSNVITANIQSTASTTAYCLDLQTSGATAGNGTFLRGFVSGATQTINILNNGNVTNTNNSYGAISDVKLKENITDATPKLAQLNQVRVVNYNFKEGQAQKQIGVIAQELEQIFPAMVEESQDRDAEGNDLGTTTKSVKYSVFVPMLIKALQEQQAIINTLTARIEALEQA